MGNDTSGWAKINFLNCLGEEWSPYPLSQLWTWFQLGTDFLGLVLGGNINMVADCYGWSQVLLNSLQCCFSDWWFYLLMLHSYLSYNNFHCGYNLALLVCYNKIYQWFKTTRFIFWFREMGVTSSNLNSRLLIKSK